MGKLATIDIIIFLIYFVVVASYGLWIYKKKKSESTGSKDYFLAEGSLTWWAIGASLIASNISAEQFIGMSGEGFFVGVAVAAYEWIAAVALIIIAVWFIPIYLKNKIYTMPQFLETRYNKSVSLIMAVFWLFLYVIVNLTSILYLGALAIDTLLGGEHLHIIMIVLLLMALLIGLGGMKVIGYTDVIQVAVLIIGGFATVYMALQIVDQRINGAAVGNALAGFNTLMNEAPGHFKLMLNKPTTTTTTLGMPQNMDVQKYVVLPGLAMYFAGQWIVNLNYWGCNQYITQRALGADLKTARTGILFAGFLKLFMPIIVMLPGIAAYVLYTKGQLPGFSGVKDGAYSAILGFLPEGLKGLAVAALTAAIVASLAGKVNSISTIFTLDIYKKYLKTDATEIQMVRTGRWVIISAMIIALAFTWTDVLGIGGEGGFTFIQKYTGFISPGVFAMFLLGMFWKRTTGTAALVGVILGFVLAIFFNSFAIGIFGKETWLYTAFTYEKLENGVVHTITEIPFLINMGWSFFITIVVMVLISLAGPKVNPKAFAIDSKMFKVDSRTMVLIVITLLLLTAIYVRLW
ncbi:MULTISPECIES: sodium:solute symporter family transporter [Chryseobacterium]|uniref:SSS family solute:Na+ symporter n=1 Tax=Chryseobacterium camelliae TaxID=1265445 RepID=A0ABU0TGA7_9FLAO|nr:MULTISPECIES: sodium/solute symporter [Chryseobacterium]MDT3406110.1 SSS family solute:Na+ symporter [Pseudacidovorax intermedius]MDQ1096088.1 SSS family solute:Na+ symporter [Chryseobacterium camelliae]MDQ1100024.1 SSS family solute:Na+ symporter [Chryseobacterium sp. SORGH_AS_1048]MDR6087368.1 SSS family solute:Na+ symporter [Chryseobacterium sp. SORGH_AS_0909]MDR6131743.1 SSS family solute:Na+ symporter [Chryseobacterium sp. SORGH_AS_1175]